MNEATIYIVPTPIGNLKDITLRALEILKIADFIICEDTRVTAKLLHAYEIEGKKFVVYNDHSDANVREKISALLREGKILALVSDAGTPLISDPGYKLINFLREEKHKIISLPGASAVTTAIAGSGIACDNFLFLGFLPTTKIQKENFLKSLPKNFTFIFFESANRVIETLESISEVMKNRKVAVAKELTKIHEEIICDTSENLLRFFEENPNKLRGEFVILVEKSDKKNCEINKEDLAKELQDALNAGLKLKEISQNFSEIYDINKKEIYHLALEISKKQKN